MMYMCTCAFKHSFSHGLVINTTKHNSTQVLCPTLLGFRCQDIPADDQTLKDDSEANEANPDKRNPQAVRDKKVEADEFEEGASENKNSSLKDKPMEVDAMVAGATAAARDAWTKQTAEHSLPSYTFSFSINKTFMQLST